MPYFSPTVLCIVFVVDVVVVVIDFINKVTTRYTKKVIRGESMVLEAGSRARAKKTLLSTPQYR